MEERTLDIRGRFENEAELRNMIALRKICYDSEPFYVPDKNGGMTQIGFRLTLYGTLPPGADDATPDSELPRGAATPPGDLRRSLAGQ